MHRPAPSAGPYLTALRAEIGADWPIYALTLLYAAAGGLYLTSLGGSPLGMLKVYAWAWTIQFAFFGPLILLLIGVAKIALRIQRRKTLAYRAMFAPIRVARLLAGTLLLLTALLIFTSVFSAIKTTMPVGRGFLFDVAQADIDKAIHFGVDPWRWLYAVAENSFVLRVVEANYNVAWFLICYFTLYWIVTSPHTHRIRIRYVLTWLASWIVVGNLMASHWLSAGPAFYGLVTGDTARFGEQLLFLSQSAGEPNSAHNFQSYLWRLYQTGLPGIGSGISAFPSMHVAVATLNALFVGELSRRWASVMWAYVALVIGSSVYLAWHYAIDGYVSVITVSAVYWALRRFLPVLARLRWRRNTPDPSETATASEWPASHPKSAAFADALLPGRDVGTRSV